MSVATWAIWTVVYAVSVAEAQDLNCGDFNSQVAAQQKMRDQWLQDHQADPDGLDGPIRPTPDGITNR